MHIVLASDIEAPSDERWESIDDSMRESLGALKWERALTTFYVVEISSEADREGIKDALTEVAMQADEEEGVDVTFVISPTMRSGTYNSYLPSDMWPDINARTG